MPRGVTYNPGVFRLETFPGTTEPQPLADNGQFQNGSHVWGRVPGGATAYNSGDRFFGASRNRPVRRATLWSPNPTNATRRRAIREGYSGTYVPAEERLAHLEGLAALGQGYFEYDQRGRPKSFCDRLSNMCYSIGGFFGRGGTRRLKRKRGTRRNSKH